MMNEWQTRESLRSNRRRFLKTSAAGAAAISAPQMARAASPNDKLILGMIGMGGMGRNHLRQLARRKDVTIAYVCDADSQQGAAAVRDCEKSGGGTPKNVADMRRIFEDREVDAVWIATPDHWHTPAAVLACDAGKHVYVEKPVSHNVQEGRLLIEAAERNKVVVQHGTQSRSTAHVMEAMKALREGAIGRVLVAKAWNSQRRRSIGKTQGGSPPGHLDFPLWLGPAPEVPFRSNMLHATWRWWLDYGCGDIGNDGVHDIDIARWGLGEAAERHPDRIASFGGKYFFDDDQQWPDTQTVMFEYAPRKDVEEPRQLVFEQRIWSPYPQEGFENGNAFYGTEGWLLLGKHGGWRLFGPRNELLREGKGNPDLGAHHGNFLDLVRGKGEVRADARAAHLSSSLCHLANIAWRTGRTLDFDPQKELVKGDEEANALLGRKYSGHWSVPKRA